MLVELISIRDFCAILRFPGDKTETQCRSVTELSGVDLRLEPTSSECDGMVSGTLNSDLGLVP